MLVFDINNQRAYRYEEKESLDFIQSLVGGYIKSIPRNDPDDTQFIAYANEDCVFKNFPTNFMAQYVLNKLGFIGEVYSGTIILMGENEKSISDGDMLLIDEIVDEYLKEISEN